MTALKPSSQHNDSTTEADDENSAAHLIDTDVSSVDSDVNVVTSPFNRLVDFFCVMGSDMNVENKTAKEPTDLQFDTQLIDCVPAQREDMDFPAELPMFCFPGGCRLSCEQQETKVFNFVLTTSSGDPLFLSAAMMYEPITSAELSELYWDRNISLPNWLADADADTTYYIPKTIAVISHHPYYDAQSHFLHELMRLQIKGSTLPLERYIANFVYDVPLPRAGGAVVRWDCFGRSEGSLDLVMGSSNKLPLLYFSYEPLFRTLSVTNILVLWATLLQEGKIVLRSNHLSLLTPVAEALLSLLFPFTWQGMYIPILPGSMVEAIEAPIPFLVGIHGECEHQPHGVIICDIDEDIVHLGWDYNGQESSMPVLPRQASLTLKAELSEIVDRMYLIPACGVKGRVTRGEDELLSNSMREIYGHMSILKESSNVDIRYEILNEAGSVRLTGDGNINDETSNDDNDGQSPGTEKRVVGLSYAGMKKQRERVAKSFYDKNERLENFVRQTFLWFLTSLLGEYAMYQKQTFRKEAYLMTFLGNSRCFAEKLVNSQMFEQFLSGPATRRYLFDKCIARNTNEVSKDPEGAKIGENRKPKGVVIPHPPSKVGIRGEQTFVYDTFPKLEESELLSNATCNNKIDSNVCSFGSFCWTLCGPRE